MEVEKMDRNCEIYETPEEIIEKLQAQGLKVKRWTKGGNNRKSPYNRGFSLEN